MKTIFISGESGTIPMQIQYLAKAHNFNVINTQLEPNYLTELKKHQSFKVRKPELDFLCRNWLLNYESFWNEVDLVIHSGAFVGTDYCGSDPALAIRTNVEGTQNIVDICNKYKIPMIYFSTTAILDPKHYNIDSPMTEETPINPQTLYGITKYAGELIVRNTCETKRMIVRPVFGFGNYPDDLHSALTKIIYVLYRNIKDKETSLTVLLDKSIPKSYTRVENIATCVMKLSQLLLSSSNSGVYTYNIGENYKQAKDWYQIISIIASCFESENICNKQKIYEIFDDKIKFVPEKDYLHAHNMDDKKIKEIGFEFQKDNDYISIERGIRETLLSVCHNIDKEPYWL